MGSFAIGLCNTLWNYVNQSQETDEPSGSQLIDHHRHSELNVVL